MSPDRTTHISKFLSYVLRHKPDVIGITLDDNGWVDVATLLAAAATHGTPFTREELDHVVATNDKKRFAFSDDNLRIRASQGHSVNVDLDLPPTSPPELLYHGTATRFLDAIRLTGLQKMSRQHVHLSPDIATASKVGTRHGKLAMLTIRSGDMHRAAHPFFHSANSVWLTEEVPVTFIEFPQ